MKLFLAILLILFYKAEAQNIEYTYDFTNRIVQLIYPKQIQIRFAYDKNGNRITQSISSLKCNFINVAFTANSIRQDIAKYQWQINTGNGFINITDNSSYQGTSTNLLQLTQPPTTWYGYIYQCIVTYRDNSTFITTPFVLTFVLNWTGEENTAWENPKNWNCGIVPDENTDVFLNPGAPNYQTVNFDAKCRSLQTNPGTSINIIDCVKLEIGLPLNNNL